MFYGKRFICSVPRALSLVFVFAVGSLFTNVGHAGYMASFTGYTQMSDSSTATEVVNFAVYNNTSGNWATALGITPSAGADTGAAYVYLYEVVNNGGSSSTIGNFNVNSTATPYTSSGFLNHVVFSDGSAVGPAGNQYLGPNPASMPPDDPSNSAPSVSGVTPGPTFVSSASAVNPFGSNTGGSANGDAAQFVFLSTTNFSQSLTSGLFSTVLFLTSNIGPLYSTGRVLNTVTGNSSDGGIPTQAPEPATLAIWGLGTLGLAFAARKRRKNGRLGC